MSKGSGFVGDMVGNRFAHDMVLRWWRIGIYRTDIPGLMAKMSGGIVSILIGCFSFEIDLLGSPSRGLGDLVREFGIGFSIGEDDAEPPCPDVRFLFLFWSWLTRLRPAWKMDGAVTVIPLVPRSAKIKFRDVAEEESVLVDAELHAQHYTTTNGQLELVATLVLTLQSKVMVIDRSTGDTIRFSTVRGRMDGGISAENINKTVAKMLNFPSRRLWINKSFNTIREKQL